MYRLLHTKTYVPIICVWYYRSVATLLISDFSQCDLKNSCSRVHAYLPPGFGLFILRIHSMYPAYKIVDLLFIVHVVSDHVKSIP